MQVQLRSAGPAGQSRLEIVLVFNTLIGSHCSFFRAGPVVLGRKNLSLDDDVSAVDGFPGRVDGGRQDLAPVNHLDERHAPGRGIQHLDIETSLAADCLSRLLRGVDDEDEFEVLLHLMVALLVAVALILAGVGDRLTECKEGCQADES